jgi:DNA-binding transcriptional ArsR family regulator
MELAKPFDMSMPAITKHLKVLENAGLISRGREAQWRPCRLEPEGIKQVADWVEECQYPRRCGPIRERAREEGICPVPAVRVRVRVR